jgi:uncharacterized membrane protein YcaP (DUF421 family)
MDAVLRGSAIYLIIFVVIRLSGRRTLGETTTFDFVLLLIIAETTQQALLGDDFSITNSTILILTLVGIDVTVSFLKTRSNTAERVLDGVPMIVVENGRPLAERLRKSRIDEGDVLSAARRLRGLERMDQIKYAVLEASGGITIIPHDRDGGTI